jgi:hypothetical protein
MIDIASMVFVALAIILMLKLKTGISKFVVWYFSIWVAIESILYLSGVHPSIEGNEHYIPPYLFIVCLYQYLSLQFLNIVDHSKIPIIAVGGVMVYCSINIITEYFGIEIMSYYVYQITTVAWIALLIEGIRSGGFRVNNTGASSIYHHQRHTVAKSNAKKV